MEMMRRFYLVGVSVVILPGSMVQLALAALFALLYTAILVQAQPYSSRSDNYMALVTSISIVIILVISMILKLVVLVETPSIKAVMAPRQQDIFHVDGGSLIALFTIAVFTVFFFVGLLVAGQTAAEKRYRLNHQWVQQLRRLRYQRSGEVVVAKKLSTDSQFHVFLSHVCNIPSAIRTSVVNTHSPPTPLSLSLTTSVRILAGQGALDRIKCVS